MTLNTRGRMVARDVHGLVDQAATLAAGTDRLNAETRVGQILNLAPHDIVPTYIRLRHFLRESDLTINFTAYKLFNSVPAGDTYDNQFGGSGQKWGGASYLKDRDTAEEAMFDFAGLKRGGGNVAPKSVLDRIKKYGQFDTNTVDFLPIARPKYCAVNYTRDPSGAASQWGKCFFVMHEHVKHNCTYVESDSFDFTLGTETLVDAGGKALRDTDGKVVKVDKGRNAHLHVATYFQPDRLFLNLAPIMITRMYDALQGRKPSGTVGSTAYIEAHLHGDLRFDRDVAKIVISDQELSESKIKSAAATFPKYLKEVNAKKVESNIKTFAKKHNIVLERA